MVAVTIDKSQKPSKKQIIRSSKNVRSHDLSFSIEYCTEIIEPQKQIFDEIHFKIHSQRNLPKAHPYRVFLLEVPDMTA